MAASHCLSWWRWWPDTLWVTGTRLWQHLFVTFGLVQLELRQWGKPSKCFCGVFLGISLILFELTLRPGMEWPKARSNNFIPWSSTANSLCKVRASTLRDYNRPVLLLLKKYVMLMLWLMQGKGQDSMPCTSHNDANRDTESTLPYSTGRRMAVGWYLECVGKEHFEFTIDIC